MKRVWHSVTYITTKHYCSGWFN